MPNAIDLLYGAAAAVTAPIWVSRRRARQKVRTALANRMGRLEPRDRGRDAILIHAVSLGELNSTRLLIHQLRNLSPHLDFVVSTTTDTGFARSQVLYGQDKDVRLVRFPLDFSKAVRRFLDAVHCRLIVLMELELWPNFLAECRRRGLPVVVINGRMTSHSFDRYRRIRPLLRRMFAGLTRVIAQEDVYAKRFVEMGTSPSRVSVTGTMKFDTAPLSDTIDGAEEVSAAVGLHPGQEHIWVCGSTGPGEEPLILDVYRQLLSACPHLRLVIVPRKPERFDEVARIISAAGFSCVRRSVSRDALSAMSPPATEPTHVSASTDSTAAATPTVVLGDTLGELRMFYAVANYVFVGRTLVDLGSKQHGSDMIESAALAKPTIVGPFTGNFAEPMNCFRREQAMVEVADAPGLRQTLEHWIAAPEEARHMGERAQAVVRRERGATARNVEVIQQELRKLSAAIEEGKAGAVG